MRRNELRICWPLEMRDTSPSFKARMLARGVPGTFCLADSNERSIIAADGHHGAVSSAGFDGTR